jgi:hypothetical protein
MTTSTENTGRSSESRQSPLNKGLVDFRQELRRRIEIANAVSHSRKALSYEVEACRRDPNHFVNNWCWTFDPRRRPANLPFRTFDFQTELLRWICDRYQLQENGLVEKSRDVGASWIFLAWFLHQWLFTDGFFGRLGSRKEDLVDDWTEESLFGKLRYIFSRLPWFILPKGFSDREHNTHLLLVNPANENKIVGESTNDDFGRGGRSSACLLDEAASIPRSERVLASVSQNSNCTFHLSSPKGKNNAFCRLRHETPIPVFQMHWSRDPRKDEAWYEKQKELLLPWEVGQELDLSYDVETGEKIYTRFTRQWHVAKEVIQPNLDFEQFRSWDFGHGVMALIWGQVAPDNTVEIYQCYEASEQDIEFFIPIARGYLPAGYALLKEKDQKELRRVLKKVPKHIAPFLRDYGDHAGHARTANSKRSCAELMSDQKIDLITSGKQTYDWRFRCLDRLLRLRPADAERNVWKSKLLISPDCTRLIDCMNNYINSPAAINRGEVQPVINWASHLVTALEFFAINRFPVEGKTPGVKEVTFR